ncbi:MAG: hypothetical protein ACXAC5_04575 [Promethearchaeota archaeon]|jgi:hypothetical protein
MPYVPDSLKSNSLDLRYTTEEEKATIAEAIEIIDSIEELYGRKLNGEKERYDKEFQAIRDIKFRQKEWTRANGAFKVAHIKAGIVIKNLPKDQFEKEVKLWRDTRYNPRLKKFRKNFARIFGAYKGFMFQRKVDRITRDCPYDKKCAVIAGIMNIEDWYVNHGHDQKGNPIWFDSRI